MSTTTMTITATTATPPRLTTAIPMTTSTTFGAATAALPTTTRVRFDAECVLIPDLPPTKRPMIITKSYSLPLWRKRTNSEEDSEQRVIRVALPSFNITPKKSTSRSRERSSSNHNPSPPLPTTIPSCLRPPSVSFTKPTTTPPGPPMLSLSIPALSPASLSSPTDLGTHPPPPPPSPAAPPFSTILAIYTSSASAPRQEQTVPLRACCPECAAHTDAREESFSRSAERVRRRAQGCGYGYGWGATGEGGSLYAAARAGGFLDGQDGEGRKLITGTGLAEVNRLVAALEDRRTRGSRTPSPVPSPSLLGPALGRVVDSPTTDGAGGEPYGELLSVEASTHSASGRGSPLLPLGIAVDEVDKERRRKSGDFGYGIGQHTARVIMLDEELDEEVGPLPRTPSPRASPTTRNPSHSYSHPRRPPARPIAAYADDDDADLFPLPSASSSRTGTPAASPAASETSLHRLGHANVKGSPRSAGLLPAALAGARAGAGVTPYSREGVQDGEAARSRCRSRSEAVCVALGSAGHRALNGAERDPDDDDPDARGEVMIIPPLAASVLAAGPYSPTLAPRAPQQQQQSLAAVAAAAVAEDAAPGHLRVASVPKESSPSPARSAVSPAPAPAPAPAPLRRSSSLGLRRARTHSTSSSSQKDQGGARTGAFGALVGVLKGVTAMSGPVAV